MQPSERLRDRRVLVVDDDPAMREMLRTQLTLEGAIVTTAASAEQAFVAMGAGSFDVLLVDLSMPVVNGFDFVAQLRLRPAAAGGRVPVIALTGYISADDQSRAFSSGFQAYLIKPAEAMQLIDTVARFADAPLR